MSVPWCIRYVRPTVVSTRRKADAQQDRNLLVHLKVYSNTPIKTIIIDAGHGGKDPGAVGYRGTKEKDIALDVAKRLEKKLSKNMKVKIVMTRDEDIFLRLSERTNIR